MFDSFLDWFGLNKSKTKFWNAAMKQHQQNANGNIVVKIWIAFVFGLCLISNWMFGEICVFGMVSEFFKQHKCKSCFSVCCRRFFQIYFLFLKKKNKAARRARFFFKNYKFCMLICVGFGFFCDRKIEGEKGQPGQLLLGSSSVVSWISVIGKEKNRCTDQAAWGLFGEINFTKRFFFLKNSKK